MTFINEDLLALLVSLTSFNCKSCHAFLCYLVKLSFYEMPGNCKHFIVQSQCDYIYICIYIYIYVYIYLYTFIYTATRNDRPLEISYHYSLNRILVREWVSMEECMCINLSMNLCINICVHVCIWKYECKYVCTYICMHVILYKHVRIYAYIYIHTCISTYDCVHECM